MLCLCVSLCACGENEVVKKAEDFIMAIGEVSPDNDEKVVIAKTYYDTLTENEKKQVGCYDILEEAINSLNLSKNEKTSYKVTPFSSCSFFCRTNDVFALADECTVEVKNNEDIFITVYPTCHTCGMSLTRESIKIKQSEFEGKTRVQKFNYVQCRNRNCKTLMFLYGVNVDKKIILMPVLPHIFD